MVPEGQVIQPNQLEGKQLVIVGTGGGASGARMVKPVSRAKELGVRIILLDTEDSAVREYADRMVSVDVTNFTACQQAIECELSDESVDGIVTFVEERTVIVSELQEYFGFPGHSVMGSKAARDKFEMRKFLRENCLPTPQFAFVDNREAAAELARWFPAPAFLKVSDGGGSVATRPILAKDQFVAAFDEALWEISNVVPHDIRRSILASFKNERPNFLIEEYLAPADRLLVSGFGRVTIELLVQDSNIRFFAVADGRCVSAGDHRYDTLCFPSQLNKEDIRAFRDLAERLVDAFGLSNGPLILDAVMTEKGPQIYEINSRIDSSLVLPLVSSCWGVEMIDETLKIAAGVQVDRIDRPKGSVGAALVHLVMAPEASRIARLQISNWSSGANDCKVHVLKREGDHVSGPEAAYDCIAIVEVTGTNQSEAEERLQLFLNGLDLTLDPVSPGNF